MPLKRSAPAHRPNQKDEASPSRPKVPSEKTRPADLFFRLPLHDIDPREITVRVEQPDLLTIWRNGPENGAETLRDFQLPPVSEIDLRTGNARYENGVLTIRFLTTKPAPSDDDEDFAHWWLSSASAGHWYNIPVDIVPPAPATIPAPPETDKPPMLDKTKSFVQDGIRYYPLSIAAPVVQAPPSTLLDWIKKETRINGKPLLGFYFAPANRHFISEESIERAAKRFIKWPSEEPAGPVTLGEKRDQTGYIHLTEAARTIGVHHHTLWRWTTKETRPTDKPLDVIKDPASDQLYIRQKDVSALKKLIPRGGLRAGRRSPPALLP